MRVRVIEGRAAKTAVPIEVAGQSLGEGHPVKFDADSLRYELTWSSYVLYQVLNESFGCEETSEDGVLGGLAGVYKTSNLLRYVFHTSNASNEYPGKLLHFRIVCADHVIDVISTVQPACRRIGPKIRVQ